MGNCEACDKAEIIAVNKEPNEIIVNPDRFKPYYDLPLLLYDEQV